MQNPIVTRLLSVVLSSLPIMHCKHDMSGVGVCCVDFSLGWEGGLGLKVMCHSDPHYEIQIHQ